MKLGKLNLDLDMKLDISIPYRCLIEVDTFGYDSSIRCSADCLKCALYINNMIKLKNKLKSL